jgi:hypothetical protein
MLKKLSAFPILTFIVFIAPVQAIAQQSPPERGIRRCDH